MRLNKNLMIFTKTSNNKLDFYMYNHKLGEIYLFTEPKRNHLYTYFKKVRNINEIMHFHGWSKNRDLDRVIKKIPVMVRYCLAEYADNVELNPA